MQELADLAKNLELTSEKFISRELKINSESVSVNELTIRCMGVFKNLLEIWYVYRGLKVLGDNIHIVHFKEESKSE